jgi:hypothetical protein
MLFNGSLALQVDKIRCCEICANNFDAASSSLFSHQTGRHAVTKFKPQLRCALHLHPCDLESARIGDMIIEFTK